MQSADQGVYTRCVACELRQVFDAVHHASACVGERKHKSLVGDEVLHTVSLTARLLDTGGAWQLRGSVKTTPGREEHGKRGDKVAEGGPGVFEYEVFKHVVPDLQAVYAFHPVLQVFETPLEEMLLHLVAAIESDFLGIGNQAGVQGAEVAFSSPLDSL